ncbi:MAG: hypothetical protein ACXWM8_04205, partial [Candidatus Limnocylindrales bacterium]
GDPKRSGESKVAQFADWAVPAMGRAMGDPPLPGKPAEPPEDEWKFPTGPLDATDTKEVMPRDPLQQVQPGLIVGLPHDPTDKG